MTANLDLNSLTPQGAYRYRALKLAGPFMRGADCFALQTGLGGLEEDGVFGPATEKMVLQFQADVFTDPRDHDGVAGIKTQREIALHHIRASTADGAVPEPLIRGQVEHESGFQLGNHTAKYKDGSRDEGVTQRNTQFATPGQAFNVPDSVATLVARVARKHDDYVALGKVKDPRRLWLLASDSWNSPSWSDMLARGGTLPANQLALVESYLAAISVYYY